MIEVFTIREVVNYAFIRDYWLLLSVFFPPFHILEFVVEVCSIREVVNFALRYEWSSIAVKDASLAC